MIKKGEYRFPKGCVKLPASLRPRGNPFQWSPVAGDGHVCDQWSV